jgi:hypothetical protein
MKKGFICECGKYHEFGGYVAAHWREVLVHTCEACGRKHSVLAGNVRLIKSPRKKELDAEEK